MNAQQKPTKSAVREARLAAAQAAQAAERRRKALLLRGGLVAAVVVVIAVVAITIIVTHKSKVATKASSPAGVTTTFGYPTGTATKPVIDLYEDFQCPVCEQYESNIGADIEAFATSGKASVVYHSLTFLDSVDKSSPANVKQSSTRAASAAACAQDQGKFLAFHDVVYKNPPATEGAGFTDAQLIGFGKTAGVPDMAKFTQCFDAKTYVPFLSKVSAEADQRQVTGTPTIFVDGKMLSFTSAKTFADVLGIITAAVAAAK